MKLKVSDKLKIIRDIRNSNEDDGLLSYQDIISYCDEYAEQSPEEFGVESFDKRIDEETKQPLYYVKIRGKVLNINKNEYLARRAIYLRNARTDLPAMKTPENA